MSKYNSYAKRLNETAKSEFAKFIDAKKSFEEAEKYYHNNKRPEHGIWSANAEMIARAARAEADYVEKKEAYDQARRAFNNSVNNVSAIRNELVSYIQTSTMARPDDLDGNTIELLKSGILNPAEYENLATQNENNPTMLRLIGSYAKQAADKANADGDSITRKKLSCVVDAARKADGHEYIDAFDHLASVYNRCVNNPAMISHWDELTSATVENF